MDAIGENSVTEIDEEILARLASINNPALNPQTNVTHEKIFEIDASEMMLAFEDMMRKRIVMPAHFLRQAGESIGNTFAHFSDAAQRLGVYTSRDYTHILDSLIKEWDIANISSLTGAAEKARDYLMSLPERFKKISDRGLKAPVEFQFNWIKY